MTWTKNCWRGHMWSRVVFELGGVCTSPSPSTFLHIQWLEFHCQGQVITNDLSVSISSLVFYSIYLSHGCNSTTAKANPRRVTNLRMFSLGLTKTQTAGEGEFPRPLVARAVKLVSYLPAQYVPKSDSFHPIYKLWVLGALPCTMPLQYDQSPGQPHCHLYGPQDKNRPCSSTVAWDDGAWV